MMFNEVDSFENWKEDEDGTWEASLRQLKVTDTLQDLQFNLRYISSSDIFLLHSFQDIVMSLIPKLRLTAILNTISDQKYNSF